MPADSLASLRPTSGLVLQALTRLLGNESREVTADEVRFLVDLIEAVGWDPAAADPQDPYEATFFEVLTLARGPMAPTPPDLSFPIELEAFKAQALSPLRPARNHEWLMSLTLASGYNPWTHQPPRQHWSTDRVMVESVLSGRWAVLEQLMRLPGAPTVETLLTLRRGDLWGGLVPTLGADLVNQPDGHQALPRLASVAPQGLEPSAEMWAWATRESVEAMMALGATFPTSKKDQQAIRAQWDKRLQRNGISRQDYTHMLGLAAQAMGAKAPNPEQTKALTVLHQTLGHGWGKRLPQDPSGDWLDPEWNNLSVDFLTTPMKIQGTTLDGTWTPLAGFLVQQLKATGNRDSWRGGLPLERWAMGAGENAHGAFRAAQNLEWRPGISQDGVIALALLSQEPMVKLMAGEMDLRLKSGRPSFRDLEDTAEWLGIEDFEAFVRKHRDSAVVFTEAATSSRSSKPAARALVGAWAQAFARFPTWLDDTPELATRLLQALFGNGETLGLPLLIQNAGSPSRYLGDDQKSWVLRAIGQRFGFTKEQAILPDLATLSAPDRRLMVEFAVALENTHWVEGLAEAAEAGLLEPDTLDRLKAWQDHHADKPNPETCVPPQAWARLRSMRLNLAFATPVPDGRKPRF